MPLIVSRVWETQGIEKRNEANLGYLAKLFSRSGGANSRYAAVRMSKHGHHFYSILASDFGFEYVFKSGVDRWSTISPSLANRILEKNKNGEIGNQIASNQKQFLALAIGSFENEETPWTPSKVIYYSDRELAIMTEQKILEVSWAKTKDELDD